MTRNQDLCPFCEIVAGRAPATIVKEWDNAIAIVPLGPVVEGHTLVIPRSHVEDFTSYPYVSAMTMLRAAELGLVMGPVNLITSKGREATQSVFHLHFHLVPRRENDGLALPWYSGRSRAKSAMDAARCEVCDRVVPVGAESRIGTHFLEGSVDVCLGSGRRVDDGRH